MPVRSTNLRRLACAAHVARDKAPDTLFSDATRSASCLAAAEGSQPVAEVIRGLRRVLAVAQEEHGPHKADGMVIRR